MIPFLICVIRVNLWRAPLTPQIHVDDHYAYTLYSKSRWSAVNQAPHKR